MAVFDNYLKVGCVAFIVGLGVSSSVVEAKKEDPVVAKINGKPLHLSQIMADTGLTEDQMKQMPENTYFQLLEGAIGQTVVLQEAEKQGLSKNPDIKRTLEKFRKQLLQQAYLSKNVQISEEDVKKRYQELVKSYEKGEKERHVYHVLVEDKAEAEKLISQLDSGSSFEQLARDNSIDGSSAQGGDLGFIRKRVMVPAFAEAAFSQKLGVHSSQPVSTQFGWHIIKATEEKDAVPPSEEEAIPDLTQEIGTVKAMNHVGTLVGRSTIERFDRQGKPLKK